MTIETEITDILHKHVGQPIDDDLLNAISKAVAAIKGVDSVVVDRTKTSVHVFASTDDGHMNFDLDDLPKSEVKVEDTKKVSIDGTEAGGEAP